MERKYSEVDITWASVEKYYQYSKTMWTTDKNGIPRYTLLGENDKRIEIEDRIWNK